MGIERGTRRDQKQGKEQDRGTGDRGQGQMQIKTKRWRRGKKETAEGLLDRDEGRKSRARVGKRERKKGTAGWTGGYNQKQ